jgi:hypothetical protein
VARKLLYGIVRGYAYFALLMFASGFIGGAWVALAGHDLEQLLGFLR